MESIETLLDSDLEERVIGEWRALAAAGLPSQADHPDPSNRPHVTLLARPSLPTEVPAPPLPIPVRLGTLLLFGAGARRTLARLVVPSVELLALHARLSAFVGEADDAPHSLPGRWTPHVTLARRVPVERLAEALAALDEGGADDDDQLSGSVVALRHWDGVAKVVTLLGP